MRRSGDTPLDDTTRSRFSKMTSIDERKRQKRDHSSSESKADAFVGSEDEDDKTNDGYFADLITNMFQRQLPSKIKSELLPAAMDLDATLQNLQVRAERKKPIKTNSVMLRVTEVTATLEAEEQAAKEEEDKAKATLANVHESVLQAINSIHDSAPSRDADSPSP